MRALLIVDLQNDFLSGGALCIKNGDEIIPRINQIIEKFDIVVASKDWHPKNHVSFKKNSPLGLWPSHCEQHSEGANFPKSLKKEKIKKVFLKGSLVDEDSYVAFYNGSHKQSTGLHEYLKDHGVKTLYIVGLALDVCVKSTAIEALLLGYQVVIVKDCCALLDKKNKIKTLQELKDLGVIVKISNEIDS